MTRTLFLFIAFCVVMGNGFTPSCSSLARRLQVRITYTARVSKDMHAKMKRNKSTINARNANAQTNTSNADAHTDVNTANAQTNTFADTDNKGRVNTKCQCACDGCLLKTCKQDLLSFPRFRDC